MAVRFQEDIRMFAEVKKSIIFDSGTRECSRAAILTALCFKASMKTHFAHLKTCSYSEHKAFEEFYEEISELGDRFAETYQGRFGKIEDYPWVKITTFDGKHVIEILVQWIEYNKRYFDD